MEGDDIRVLIVEDELLVRVGIKSSVDWAGLHLTLVGEASTGQEAIGMLKLYRPEIVLLDIRLPDMSGLEILRLIRDELPNTKVIVISGLEDFDTTSEAFRLGAYDYFHKPRIQSGDLTKLLMRIRDSGEISTTNPTPGSDSVSAATLLKNILRYPEQEGWVYSLNRQLPMRAYRVMALSVVGIYEKKKSHRGFNAEITLNSAESLISELVSRQSECVFFSANANEFLFFLYTSRMDVDLSEKAEELHNRVSNMLRRFIEVSASSGLSELHRHLGELGAAVQEARSAHEMYFSREMAFSQHINHRPNDKESMEISRLIALLIETARNNRVERHLEYLQELSKAIREHGTPNRKTLLYNLQTFIYIARPDHGYDVHIAALEACETLEQMIREYRSLLQQGEAGNTVRRACGVVEQIMDYLRSHYYENITLNRLSEVFHLSRNYISRIFKEETGENLFDWLTAVRVANSKQLLTGTAMRIYEISEAVGFGSTVGYNYAFNRIVGISPSQYRKEHLLQQTNQSQHVPEDDSASHGPCSMG